MRPLPPMTTIFMSLTLRPYRVATAAIDVSGACLQAGRKTLRRP